MAILEQGTFTQPATAINQTIIVPSGADFLRVVNFTQAGATNGYGFDYWWQFGMGTYGIVYSSQSGSAVNIGQTAAGAFTLYNPSLQAPGALNNGSTGISALSNAAPPIATVGSTAGMAPGNVVRLSNVAGAQQIGGMDFTVGFNTFNSTHFDLSYAPSFGAVGATGNFRVIQYDPLYYPRRRYITAISKATQAVITLSVTHQYTVGQEVRVYVPAAFGMSQFNDVSAIITAVNTSTNTITVNVNSSAFTTFAFPSSASGYAGTPALVVPYGEDTATALAANSGLVPLDVNGNQIYNSNSGILADSTVNTGFYGITLAAGELLPAGNASDVVYWWAGKSDLGGQ